MHSYEQDNFVTSSSLNLSLLALVTSNTSVSSRGQCGPSLRTGHVLKTLDPQIKATKHRSVFYLTHTVHKRNGSHIAIPRLWSELQSWLVKSHDNGTVVRAKDHLSDLALLHLIQQSGRHQKVIQSPSHIFGPVCHKSSQKY